jgi:CheY-like chemotaxis protein
LNFVAKAVLISTITVHEVEHWAGSQKRSKGVIMPGEPPGKIPQIKILIVEDNLRDFELMEAALSKQLLCTIQLATTQKEYETKLMEERPDVIVCDSNFFSFDGTTALNIAKEKCPDIPFIFCCGYFSESVQAAARSKGVACILKDAGFTGLLREIKGRFPQNSGA